MKNINVACNYVYRMLLHHVLKWAALFSTKLLALALHMSEFFKTVHYVFLMPLEYREIYFSEKNMSRVTSRQLAYLLKFRCAVNSVTVFISLITSVD